MSKLDQWIDNKWVQNLFVWVLLFIILLGAIQADNRFLASLFALALLAPAIYINNLLILPYLRIKPFLFAFLFVVNTLFFSFLSVLAIGHFMEEEFSLSVMMNFSGIMFLAVVFGSAIKIARDSFIRRQQEKESELKLLKAQLNPHFLFNTLNNLYGLSVVKSDKLPGLMLKLSDLLRYSLYETKEALVPLEKELTYLENYISLERIRLEDQTDIQFSKAGDMTTHQVAPMLLIVFVENAFKHLEMVDETQSRVKISILNRDDCLIFHCENTYDILEASKENLETGKSGIGLVNAVKRLQLLYPDKHKLKITQEAGIYSVDLTLELK